jgi:hypothetical protein
LATRKRSFGRGNKRAKFLAAYAKVGIIGEAARLAKCDRTSHYNWMEDPDYERAFIEAHEAACDRLEEEVRKRAYDGWNEPVIYQGEIQFKVDRNGNRTNTPLTIRKKSDVLLMFAMKGARPEKYRDTWKGEIKHTGAIGHDPELAKLTDEQLEYLKSLCDAGAGPKDSADLPESSEG